MYLKQVVVALLWVYSTSVTAQATDISGPDATQEGNGTASGNKQEDSPWLIVPRFSSDPKLGTSAGLLTGYLFKLDPDSTSSMAGATGTYSNTDSYIAGAFLRSYWDSDSKRLTAMVAGGKIRNDYSDFLGSGLQASTTDNMKLLFARYLHEVHPHWFLGVQGIYTNYLIAGDNFQTQEILKAAGLNGVDSGALGLVGMFDSRDNQNATNSGIRFSIDNFAYREAFGGEDSFGTYNLEFDHYLPHANGSVFAYRIFGRWTHDAPESAYSSVDLRGYTRGQYLAPHSLGTEVEERWHVIGRFGINVFAGVTCLYGGGKRCNDSDNIYPSAGIGGQYLLKAAEHMVVTVDYAKGEGENSGFYVRFGQAF